MPSQQAEKQRQADEIRLRRYDYGYEKARKRRKIRFTVSPTTNQQVNHDGTSGGIVEAIRLVVATGIIIFPRQRAT